jgi:hypothetical protein
MKKLSFYKTARALSSCQHFKAGDIVAVSNPWQAPDGVIWFDIRETQHGKLPCVVAYPSHLLADFTL